MRSLFPPHQYSEGNEKNRSIIKISMTKKNLPQPANRGLLHEPIILNKDGIFGSERSFVGKGPVIQENGQWDDFLVPHEHQANSDFDTMSCVTWGHNNQKEIYMKRVYGVEKNYSDRFLAKAAGTTKQGNTPQKVYETARTGGALDELEWPWSSDIKTWEQYMAEIPRLLFIKAKDWLLGFDLWHDYVPTNPEALRTALKWSPVGVSNALQEGVDGVYYKPEGWRDIHWAVLIGYHDNGDWKLEDTYPPFVKRVRADTKFEVAKVIAITRRISTPSFVNSFLTWILGMLKSITTDLADVVPPPAYDTPPADLPMNKGRIEDWALAIQHEEGGKPQDHNTRSHNPGNLKYTSYTASLGGLRGAVSAEGGHFCKFPTYKAGFDALCQFLRDACGNKLKAFRSHMTLANFTIVYANVPLSHPYVKNVAQKLGVSVDTKIISLL